MSVDATTAHWEALKTRREQKMPEWWIVPALPPTRRWEATACCLQCGEPAYIHACTGAQWEGEA